MSELLDQVECEFPSEAEHEIPESDCDAMNALMVLLVHTGLIRDPADMQHVLVIGADLVHRFAVIPARDAAELQDIKDVCVWCDTLVDPAKAMPTRWGDGKWSHRVDVGDDYFPACVVEKIYERRYQRERNESEG